MKPEHCCRMSKQAQPSSPSMPSFDWRNTAVPGKWMSGERVARMMQSMSLGAQPASSIARCAAGEREIAARPRAVVGHVAPLFDARALADPVVVGLHLRRGAPDVLIVEVANLLVGDDAVGDEGAEAEDLGAKHDPTSYSTLRPEASAVPVAWGPGHCASLSPAADRGADPAGPTRGADGGYRRRRRRRRRPARVVPSGAEPMHLPELSPAERALLRDVRVADEDHGGLASDELAPEEYEAMEKLCALCLVEAVGEYGEAPDGEVDEREAGEHAVAYRITGAGVALLAEGE